jgi:predicted nucleotidyltransferase
MTQDAILRQLELTSEATKHLPAEFHERHPEFASNRLCELQDECDRNLLNIDPHFAWDVTQETLPQIKGRVETILNEDQTGQNRVNQARFFKHDENRGPSMATNALVSDNRAEILRIATEHGATRVRILGSFARGTARLDSDVDLLIELAPGRHLMELIAIKQDLEDLLERQVHVVTEAAISPYIRDEVLRSATPL